MQVAEINTKKLDTAVINYIEELKANYEQRIEKINTNYEQQIEDKNNEINKYKNESIDYYNKYIEYKDKYTLLTHKYFGRSSEKAYYDEKQPFLFSGEAEPVELPVELPKEEENAKEEKTEVKSYTRNKRGRKPINPNIPRKERLIDLPENEKTCACGTKLTEMGKEITERLVFKPAEFYVDRIIRPQYVCRCCEGTDDEEKPGVRVAPVEPLMIPGGIATPSVLATVFTNKFEDHIPYTRQEKIFERIEAEISKQNMANWQQHIYKRLKPLFDLLLFYIKSGPVLQMDETSMWAMSGKKLKKEEKENQKSELSAEDRKPDINHGWMWLARGGPPGKSVTWYEYHESRAAKHAKEFLAGYKGYLQTDGYEAYNGATKDNLDIIHVACFAHARRNFVDASKITKTPLSAQEGMNYIRKLYEIENKLRNEKKAREETDNKMSEEEFVEKRKINSTPILEKFNAWLLKRSVEINPTSPMGKAVNYTLKYWDKLIAYLENYHLTPDNNACENAIRPFVVGRKNWMIAGSPEGAKSSCGIYTLIETAKQNGLKPYKYLLTLFEKAPLASTTEDWEKLLPWNIEIQ